MFACATCALSSKSSLGPCVFPTGFRGAGPRRRGAGEELSESGAERLRKGQKPKRLTWGWHDGWGLHSDFCHVWPGEASQFVPASICLSLVSIQTFDKNRRPQRRTGLCAFVHASGWWFFCTPCATKALFQNGPMFRFAKYSSSYRFGHGSMPVPR